MLEVINHTFTKSEKVQPFNVLCVTYRTTKDGGRALFHQRSPSKVAEVVTSVSTSPTLEIAQTLVYFMGKLHELRHIRNGLSGACLVLGIKIEHETDGFDLWELYTDTPSDKPSWPGGVTSELLREAAPRFMRHP